MKHQQIGSWKDSLDERQSVFEQCPNCLGRGYIYWGTAENPRGCKCDRCEGTGKYRPLKNHEPQPRPFLNQSQCAMKKPKAKSDKMLVEVALRFRHLGMDPNSFNNLPLRQQKLFLNGKGTLVTATFRPWGAFSTVVPRTIKQLAGER